MDSSDEDDQDESIPNYCNELYKFKNETREIIRQFKDSRSKYIFNENYHASTSNRTHEGESSSDIYQGRCLLLRKLGFRTVRLRSHYKTLRPFKNYTLNRQISTSEAPPEDKDEREGGMENPVSSEFQVKQAMIRHDKKTRFSIVYTEHHDDDDDEELERQRHYGPGETTFNQGFQKTKPKKSNEKWYVRRFEEKQDKKKMKEEKNRIKREKREKKREERMKIKSRNEEKMRERKLNLRVLDNLNVEKHGHKYLEPCMCDNGKEVTVVIKGFCLCKKMKQGKHRFQKVCEQYGKPFGGSGGQDTYPPPGLLNIRRYLEKDKDENLRHSAGDGEGQREGRREGRRVSVIDTINEKAEKQPSETGSEGRREERRRVSLIDDGKNWKEQLATDEEQKEPTSSVITVKKVENLPTSEIDVEELEKRNSSEVEVELEERRYWLEKDWEEVEKSASSEKDVKEEQESVPPPEAEEEEQESAPLPETVEEEQESAPPPEALKEKQESVSLPEAMKVRQESVSLPEAVKVVRESAPPPEAAKEKQEIAPPAKVEKEKRKRVEKEKKIEKENVEEEAKKSKESLQGEKKHSGSLRTIFENKISKKSKLSLTKDQLDKMSRITRTR